MLANSQSPSLARKDPAKSPFLMAESKMVSAAMYQLPLTPTSPLSSAAMSDAGGPIEELSSKDALATALHVIRTERDALMQLEILYETDDIAQEGLANSVDAITRSISSGGKLVVVGVGKSGKIGQKVVATMNSFGIRSAFLHPTEALHGDLGLIGEVEVLVYHYETTKLTDCPRMTASLSLPSPAEPQSY